MKCNVDYSLYLVTDQNSLKNRSLIDVLEEAILGGVTLVQLREKSLTAHEFYKIATEVRALTSKYGIPLIINDRLDIALAVGADGVHVGQDDLPAKVARKLLGEDKLLGVSTATLEEALRAQEDGADYIGVGAVFPTATKDNTRRVSLEQMANINKSVNISVVGIGGINEENISSIIDTGVAGVAVASAILGANRVEEATNKLIQKFK